MNNEELVTVRCPFQKKNKHNNRIYVCNNLCVKVVPPAKGETYCTICKLAFDFDVSSQSTVHNTVRAQSL